MVLTVLSCFLGMMRLHKIVACFVELHYKFLKYLLFLSKTNAAYMTAGRRLYSRSCTMFLSTDITKILCV